MDKMVQGWFSHRIPIHVRTASREKYVAQYAVVIFQSRAVIVCIVSRASSAFFRYADARVSFGAVREIPFLIRPHHTS